MALPHSAVEGTTLAQAGPGDVPAIREIVRAAYAKYVDRIGKPPAPMAADYHHLVNRSETSSSTLPPRGRGYGRVLLECADRVARDRGLAALTLFTNAKMYENLALYAKMGYSEVGNRTESGHERVYFRKDLVGMGLVREQ
ncbi:hypothetical protein HRG_004043 [Hirsutella rhossiliensis]|uniref:N-acetyltransferase domain-containing protein n=1 Tax=Hirsutella rhossiliensis TaxID=111463 RepID=A0A9P8N7H0_9HYPO|nr:uncharacterized protein HRG_04043 [Hirsutella rhossiliensis]KAH0966027.1 hypothetical protein HRG_04043 [Hirsutella rhossiliensis]